MPVSAVSFTLPSPQLSSPFLSFCNRSTNDQHCSRCSAHSSGKEQSQEGETGRQPCRPGSPVAGSSWPAATTCSAQQQVAAGSSRCTRQWWRQHSRAAWASGAGQEQCCIQACAWQQASLRRSSGSHGSDAQLSCRSRSLSSTLHHALFTPYTLGSVRGKADGCAKGPAQWPTHHRWGWVLRQASWREQPRSHSRGTPSVT